MIINLVWRRYSTLSTHKYLTNNYSTSKIWHNIFIHGYWNIRCKIRRLFNHNNVIIILCNRVFRLEVWSSFAFASSNCYWLNYITWFILANHSCVLQKQMKIILQVERFYWMYRIMSVFIEMRCQLGELYFNSHPNCREYGRTDNVLLDYEPSRILSWFILEYITIL